MPEWLPDSIYFFFFELFVKLCWVYSDIETTPEKSLLAYYVHVFSSGTFCLNIFRYLNRYICNLSLILYSFTNAAITMPTPRWSIFIHSIFFVLGFSLIFSLIGVLYQSILSNVAYLVQNWLSYIAGSIIIFFGMFVIGLINLPFLEREYHLSVQRKLKYGYLTSFVFGAAFAIGWSPCATPALGAILALAATQMSNAFFLLIVYTLGLGIPFLLMGWFTSHAQRLINRAGRWLTIIQKVFGALLILLGILVFTSQLSRIASFELVVMLLTKLNVSTSLGGAITSLTMLNLGIALIAGIVSFLSPCVLPLLPGFLSYLASTSVQSTTSTTSTMTEEQ